MTKRFFLILAFALVITGVVFPQDENEEQEPLGHEAPALPLPAKRENRFFLGISTQPFMFNTINVGENETQNIDLLAVEVSLKLKWGIQIGLGINMDDTIIGGLSKIVGSIGFKGFFLTAQSISFTTNIIDAYGNYYNNYLEEIPMKSDYYDIALMWRGMLGISYRSFNLPVTIDATHPIMNFWGDTITDWRKNQMYEASILDNPKIRTLGIRVALDTFLRYMIDADGYWGGFPNTFNRKNGFKIWFYTLSDLFGGYLTLTDEGYEQLLSFFPQTAIKKNNFIFGTETSLTLGTMYLINLGRKERQWGKLGIGLGANANVIFIQGKEDGWEPNNIWFRMGGVIKGAISF